MSHTATTTQQTGKFNRFGYIFQDYFFSKLTLIGLMISHLIFCAFSLPVFGGKNVYPFYNWDPFHVRPDKYMDAWLLYVSELDGEQLDSQLVLPTQLKEIHKGINPFQLRGLIVDYAYASEFAREKNLASLEKYLSKFFVSISWEIREVRLEPTAFFESQTVVRSRTLLSKRTVRALFDEKSESYGAE